jgi:hypothetical protein
MGIGCRQAYLLDHYAAAIKEQARLLPVLRFPGPAGKGTQNHRQHHGAHQQLLRPLKHLDGSRISELATGVGVGVERDRPHGSAPEAGILLDPGADQALHHQAIHADALRGDTQWQPRGCHGSSIPSPVRAPPCRSPRTPVFALIGARACSATDLSVFHTLDGPPSPRQGRGARKRSSDRLPRRPFRGPPSPLAGDTY